IPNRALLHQRAEHAIAVSRRSRRPLAFLFIDLDRFKDVNDNLGHGGDEFVVLLEDVQTLEEVEQVTARMQEVLAEPLVIGGGEIHVTSSIGVALYPRDGESVSALIGKADLAMYRAKELGRKTVQFYTPDLATERTNLNDPRPRI